MRADFGQQHLTIQCLYSYLKHVLTFESGCFFSVVPVNNDQVSLLKHLHYSIVIQRLDLHLKYPHFFDSGCFFRVDDTTTTTSGYTPFGQPTETSVLVRQRLYSSGQIISTTSTSDNTAYCTANSNILRSSTAAVSSRQTRQQLPPLTTQIPALQLTAVRIVIQGLDTQPKHSQLLVDSSCCTDQE